MAQGLMGKVALVTGTARGIGRAIGLRLAQDGAAVVVNYSGSAQGVLEQVIALAERYFVVPLSSLRCTLNAP
jgi:3-oxoacyl-[acyl-carrier protein] reductase